jgi:hypothetical protein
MSEVPWATFVSYPDGDDKFSEAWLLTPANVVSLFPDGGAYCRLCDSCRGTTGRSQRCACRPNRCSCRSSTLARADLTQTLNASRPRAGVRV